jgi:hypothetical protein
MPTDDLDKVVTMAGLAAGMGAATRIALSVHAGTRSVVKLVLEGFLGAMLGVIAAAASVWYDPALRDVGWPLLVVSGAAGLAGALGTRIMDMVTDAAQVWIKAKLKAK